MRKHTKALATIMAAAALAMVTNSRIPITNIWYYVGQEGKWYCFDRNNGDMKRGTTIDGYTVDFILAGFREKSYVPISRHIALLIYTSYLPVRKPPRLNMSPHLSTAVCVSKSSSASSTESRLYDLYQPWSKITLM